MIDSQGRVFGIVNVIDLAIALSMAFLATLGTHAYRVFQIPAPVIARVEPSTVVISQTPRVRLIGRNFRHYLRVFAPPSDGPFAVAPLDPERHEIHIETVTDTSLELKLPDLADGSYDIYLFDNARELAHVAAALKIVPPDTPHAAMRLTVRLLVSDQTASLLHVGDRDTASAGATGGTAAVVLEPAELERVTVHPERVDVMDLRVERKIADDHYLWMGAHTSQMIVDAVVRVPVTATAPGRWEYKGRTVRAGEDFSFETASVKVRGTIVARDEPEAVRP